MKRIPPGTVATHSVRVTEEMTVDFGQAEPGLGKLHPVYATYWLGKHFELVSRKLTLPYLEDQEEGIGFELFVRHLLPATPETIVALEAHFERVDGNRVYCECEARNSFGEVIGVGRTTQVILPRRDLEERFRDVRERSSG